MSTMLMETFEDAMQDVVDKTEALADFALEHPEVQPTLRAAWDAMRAIVSRVLGETG